MNKKILEDSKNYTAVVHTISSTFPLEGMDNVVGTSIFGNQVLVSKDTLSGEKGLFFPCECALSKEFLSANNLFRENTLNKDIAKKGFFEENGRVKAIKFRGHKSAGFWIPIDSLESLGFNLKKEDKSSVFNLKDGEEFNELDGVLICKKYIVKLRQPGVNRGRREKEKSLKDLVDTRMFREHEDTEQLFKNLHKIRMEDEVSITVKVHGTSVRIGNVLVERELPWFQRLLKRWVPIQESEYKYVSGSRKVIKGIDFNPLGNKQHFYSEDLWTKASKIFEGKLHKGEMVYAEIIGWESESKEIQKDYSYGIPRGTYELQVYRISNVNPEGIVQDLTWPQLKTRCTEMGVKHVQEVFYGKLSTFLWGKGFQTDARSVQEDLQNAILSMLEQPSIYCTKNWKMVEEGFVLQKYQLGISEYYKAKSFAFLQHETKLLDKGEQDLEETQTAE